MLLFRSYSTQYSVSVRCLFEVSYKGKGERCFLFKIGCKGTTKFWNMQILVGGKLRKMKKRKKTAANMRQKCNKNAKYLHILKKSCNFAA